MKKMFEMIVAMSALIPIFAIGATVNDNTYDGMLERLDAATGTTYRTGTWAQSGPTSSVIKIQNKPLFHVSAIDTNATVDSTDTSAISAYEVLWTPNATDSIMYISREAGSNGWQRVPIASRLFEIVSVNTNANVPLASAYSVVATAAYQVLLTPNATNGVAFYYSSASGTNWLKVTR